MRKEGGLDRLIKRMAEDAEYLFRHLPVAPRGFVDTMQQFNTSSKGGVSWDTLFQIVGQGGRRQ